MPGRSFRGADTLLGLEFEDEVEFVGAEFIGGVT